MKDGTEMKDGRGMVVTAAWLAVGAWPALGCGGGVGSVQVQLEAEETIPGGIPAGDGDEDVIDGWSIEFDRYVIVVGDVSLEGGGDPRRDSAAVAMDLARIAEGGHPLARFEDVAATSWPQVSFSTPIATASVVRDESVAQVDFDRMVAEGCTYLIVGTATHPTGQRCVRGDPAMCDSVTSVRFDLCAAAATVYGPCESDTGIEGLIVAAGTTTTVNFTIHGDHVFFNGFPVGAEGSVARRAQWLVDSVVDRDGVVTRADLESIGASDLGQLLPSTFDDGFPGYTLGGHPIVDPASPSLDTAWEYLRAQLSTQGHFQGEGECPGAPRD
jgi:hypothetical protein